MRLMVGIHTGMSRPARLIRLSQAIHLILCIDDGRHLLAPAEGIHIGMWVLVPLRSLKEASHLASDNDVGRPLTQASVSPESNKLISTGFHFVPLLSLILVFARASQSGHDWCAWRLRHLVLWWLLLFLEHPKYTLQLSSFQPMFMLSARVSSLNAVRNNSKFLFVSPFTRRR